jgi:hypothetical protein
MSRRYGGSGMRERRRFSNRGRISAERNLRDMLEEMAVVDPSY